MEIFFNELSCAPVAGSEDAAKAKVLTLLETLKVLRQDGFNVMRASGNIFELELSANYTITNFFNDPSISGDLKTLLRGVIKRPFIEDDNTYEAEIFVLSGFTTKDENDNDLSPEGLAVAYLYNSPSISLSGSAHWQMEWIALTVTTNGNTFTEKVVNVHSPESVGANYFRQWLKNLVEKTELNSKVNVAKVFSPDHFSFDQRAIDDILSWYHNDRRFLVRIRELINDIADNPFVGGKGHTETLGGTGGRASKRIVKKDRLVYTFTKEKIIIHQCRGHYDDN